MGFFPGRLGSRISSDSQVKSDGQAVSAFLAAGLEYLASVGRLHFLAETVSSFSLNIRLIRQCLFHGFILKGLT